MANARAIVRWGLVAHLVVAAAGANLLGCKDEDDGTKPVGVEALPPLRIDDSTENLMLTWLDERGETHVESRTSAVPVKGRDIVRVVVADREEGQRDPIYVVNLNKKGADGSYAADTMPRSEWEAEIEKRREAYLAKVEPPRRAGPSPGPGPGDDDEPKATRDTVIIYGADWCHPCHDAADYLRSLGVPVIVKDIEKNPAAQSEMRAKLDKIGRSGGRIPVIDVGGEILVGYNKSSLDRALRRMRGGTSL